METVREENEKKKDKERITKLGWLDSGLDPSLTKTGFFIFQVFFFLIRKEIKHFFEFSLCCFGQTVT